VVVTGASSGIGRALALELGRRQARVALSARTASALDEVAAAIRAAGGEAITFPSDLTMPGAAARVVNATIDMLSGVDVLVNNAGVGLHAPIAEASAADVRTVFALNVLAPAEAIRAAVPRMRQQPGGGTVVNISSVAGRIALPLSGYYSATKFALTVMGDALRMEEDRHGIRVLNVFPGMTESAFSARRLGRPGRPPHQRRMASVSADLVARRIADAIEQERRTLYISWFPDRLAGAANRLTPGLVSAVLSRWARQDAGD
jgi:short-subunit dehydrogenase